MSPRSGSRSSAARRLNAETPPSQSSQQLASIELDLAQRLEHDDRFRERYLRVWAANEIATELRTMRKRRVLRQSELAAQAGTGQSAISRIEKQDYDSWTFKTLLNIASVLNARLRIRLEPLEEVIQNHKAHEAADALRDHAVVSDVGTTAAEAAVVYGGATFGSFTFTVGDSSAKAVVM